MSDQETFLRTLHADPTASDARAVYADWLEEQGDNRSEVVRLLSELAAAFPAGRPSVASRLQESRSHLPAEWIAELPWIDRLRMGDGERVWDELVQHGASLRESPLQVHAELVALETMHRVRRNTEVVVARLRDIGYEFGDPKAVHVPPIPRVEDLLRKAEDLVGGRLPLSLHAFWAVVGSVNFSQSQDQIVHDWYDTPQSELQQLGDDDPFWVDSVDSLVHGLDGSEEPWNVSRDGDRVYFCFAPDCFHKANVSGGENYHVWLPDPSADFRIVGDVSPSVDDEYAGDFFVHYLRRSVLNGGFRGRMTVEVPHEWGERRTILDPIAEGLESF